jgi:hypothetical protein
MLQMIVLLLTLSGTALAASGAVSLPDDARLAPVRAELQRRIDSVAAAGLPTDALVSKTREGLAKGVDPQRIASAAGIRRSAGRPCAMCSRGEFGVPAAGPLTSLVFSRDHPSN